MKILNYKKIVILIMFFSLSCSGTPPIYHNESYEVSSKMEDIDTDLPNSIPVSETQDSPFSYSLGPDNPTDITIPPMVIAIDSSISMGKEIGGNVCDPNNLRIQIAESLVQFSKILSKNFKTNENPGSSVVFYPMNEKDPTKDYQKILDELDLMKKDPSYTSFYKLADTAKHYAKLIEKNQGAHLFLLTDGEVTNDSESEEDFNNFSGALIEINNSIGVGRDLKKQVHVMLLCPSRLINDKAGKPTSLDRWSNLQSGKNARISLQYLLPKNETEKLVSIKNWDGTNSLNEILSSVKFDTSTASSVNGNDIEGLLKLFSTSVTPEGKKFDMEDWGFWTPSSGEYQLTFPLTIAPFITNRRWLQAEIVWPPERAGQGNLDWEINGDQVHSSPYWPGNIMTRDGSDCATNNQLSLFADDRMPGDIIFYRWWVKPIHLNLQLNDSKPSVLGGTQSFTLGGDFNFLLDEDKVNKSKKVQPIETDAQERIMRCFSPRLVEIINSGEERIIENSDTTFNPGNNQFSFAFQVTNPAVKSSSSVLKTMTYQLSLPGLEGSNNLYSVNFHYQPKLVNSIDPLVFKKNGSYYSASVKMDYLENKFYDDAKTDQLPYLNFEPSNSDGCALHKKSSWYEADGLADGNVTYTYNSTDTLVINIASIDDGKVSFNPCKSITLDWPKWNADYKPDPISIQIRFETPTVVPPENATPGY